MANPRRSSSLVALTLVALVILGPARPRTATAACAPMAGAAPSLGEVDPGVRLRFIVEGLEDAAMRARRWAWAWTSIHLLTGVVQMAMLPLVPRETWVERYVGSAASLVGIATLWALPLHVSRDAPRLRARLRTISPNDDICALVAEAERTLARDAANEARVHAWWPHAATLGFGAALFVLLSVAFERGTGGALLAAGAMTIGELRINTQPTASLALLDRYRRGDLSPAFARRPLAWALAPTITLDGRDTRWGLLAVLSW